MATAVQQPPGMPSGGGGGQPQAWQQLMAEGDKMMRKGKYDKAVLLYSDAAHKGHPKPAVVYNKRAACYRKLKQIDRVITEYNRAIELAPDMPTLYNNRGVAYTDAALGHRAKGDTQTATKQFARAKRDLKRALELNPQFADAQEHLDDVKRHQETAGDRVAAFVKGTVSDARGAVAMTAAAGVSASAMTASASSGLASGATKASKKQASKAAAKARKAGPAPDAVKTGWLWKRSGGHVNVQQKEAFLAGGGILEEDKVAGGGEGDAVSRRRGSITQDAVRMTGATVSKSRGRRRSVGDIVKNWKKRFFVLKGTQLVYFGSENDWKKHQPAKGVIELEGSVLREDEASFEKTGKMVRFDVTVDEVDGSLRVYSLRAADNDDFYSWIQVLEACEGLQKSEQTRKMQKEVLYSGWLVKKSGGKALDEDEDAGTVMLPTYISLCRGVIRDTIDGGSTSAVVGTLEVGVVVQALEVAENKQGQTRIRFETSMDGQTRRPTATPGGWISLRSTDGTNMVEIFELPTHTSSRAKDGASKFGRKDKRFFVLHADTLEYYKDDASFERCLPPRGVLNLKGAKVMVSSQVSGGIAGHSGRPKFKLVTKERVLSLTADTSGDQREWVFKIRDAVDVLQDADPDHNMVAQLGDIEDEGEELYSGWVKFVGMEGEGRDQGAPRKQIIVYTGKAAETVEPPRSKSAIIMRTGGPAIKVDVPWVRPQVIIRSSGPATVLDGTEGLDVLGTDVFLVMRGSTAETAVLQVFENSRDYQTGEKPSLSIPLGAASVVEDSLLEDSDDGEPLFKLMATNFFGATLLYSFSAAPDESKRSDDVGRWVKEVKDVLE